MHTYISTYTDCIQDGVQSCLKLCYHGCDCDDIRTFDGVRYGLSSRECTVSINPEVGEDC